MKKFFNTAAVFLANLLALKPQSWKQSSNQALAMEAELVKFQPSTLIVAGVETPVEPPLSPLGLLADASINALGFVTAVWLIYQIVTGFLAALPYLLLGACVLYLIAKFTQPKAQPMAS